MDEREKRCAVCREYFPETGEFFYKRKRVVATGEVRWSLDGKCRACRKEGERTRHYERGYYEDREAASPSCDLFLYGRRT